MGPLESMAVLGVAGIMVVGLIALGIAILVLFLMYNALNRLPPEFRLMQPGLVFLLLIPFFNWVWIFFVVTRISRSYQNYFQTQGRSDQGDCGYGVGLAWAICVVASLIPFVNFVTSIASLVLSIIFLVKITGMKNLLPLPGMAMPYQNPNAQIPPAGQQYNGPYQGPQGPQGPQGGQGF